MYVTYNSEFEVIPYMIQGVITKQFRPLPSLPAYLVDRLRHCDAYTSLVLVIMGLMPPLRHVCFVL